MASCASRPAGAIATPSSRCEPSGADHVGEAKSFGGLIEGVGFVFRPRRDEVRAPGPIVHGGDDDARSPTDPLDVLSQLNVPDPDHLSSFFTIAA